MNDAAMNVRIHVVIVYLGLLVTQHHRLERYKEKRFIWAYSPGPRLGSRI
jgi:hypothetical protein